jgi:hypothetical protein
MDNQPNLPTNSTSRRRKKLYGWLGGAALATAVALGGNSLLSTTQNTTYAQSVTASATSSADNGTAQLSPNGSRNGFGKQHGGDQALKGVSGTLSASDGNTLTLKQGDVIVIQATVNANTVYTKAGKTISLSDLKIGQLLSVRETTASDGTTSISAVEVMLNHTQGTIRALDSTGLTLTKPDNSTIKVSLSSATSYQDLGKTISLSDLKTGVKVEVAGTLNSDGSLSAEVINVEHDRLSGTITVINGSTLTIQLDARGGHGSGPHRQAPGDTGNAASNSSSSTTTTATITVASSTIYQEAGQTVQLSDLAVNDQINAVGTLSSDSKTLTALQVIVSLPHYQGQVTSVSDNTIVIQDRDTPRTIVVNSSTKYLNGQTTASLSDVKTGVTLSAEGKIDSSGKMTASLIQLGQPTDPQGH